MTAYTCTDCGRTWTTPKSLMLCPCDEDRDVKTGKAR